MWDGALNWGARGGNAGWIGVATGAPIVCAGDNVAGDLKDGSGSGLVVESDVPCTGLAGRRRLRGVSSDRCDADAHNSPASISGTLHGVEAASRASPNCFRNVSHRCNTACFSRLAAASSARKRSFSRCSFVSATLSADSGGAASSNAAPTAFCSTAFVCSGEIGALCAQSIEDFRLWPELRRQCIKARL